MKKIYTTLFSISLFGLGLAQPVIQGSDFNPAIGESFTYYMSNYITPGAAGNNVTWDLSGLTSSSTNVATTEVANSSFSASNVTLNYAGQQKIYNLNNSTGQYVYGMLAGTTVFTFSNPMQILAFPLSVTVDANDTHAATFSTGGYSFARSGTTNIKCDGWGTLITPEGTFSNVLRVCQTQIYSDVYSLGSVNYNVVIYSWYKAGIHKELASMTNYTTSMSSTVTSYGQFLETTGLGINDLEKNSSMSISPNPATDLVTIRLSENQHIESIEIVGVNGGISTVFNVSSENSTIINVQDLNSGIYLMKIKTTEGSTLMKKIVKQ